MSNEDHLKYLAEALRKAADLVERGQIPQIDVTVDYDIETRADPLTGLTKPRHTGWQTVTVVMRGNPSDLREAGFEEAKSLSAQNRLLSGGPSRD